MTERATSAQGRRRRLLMVGGGTLAVVVVIAAVWIAVAKTSGTRKATAQANPSASASASASASPAGCQWRPLGNPSPSPGASPDPVPTTVKEVGKPPASGEPRSGGQIMTVTTNLGVIVVKIDDAKTPCTAASFSYLAGQKFFDGSSCHRIVPSIHALQCGDPSGTGTGGPTYQFDDENLPVDRRPSYAEGAVAMANAGPGTNGSQFFFLYGDDDADTLAPSYTLFGRITQGLDIVKKVADGGADGDQGDHPKTTLTILSVTMSPSS